ncbi:MAG: HAD-IA family hydrolase [Woeseiaceae bacterium]|nr:HAD-IA family hydrolase [Woeseiaceae bacterium]
MTDGLANNHEAVFFDLDGTLVDTAPDMVGALQDLQRVLGRRPIEYDIGRSNVSNGAAGLLKIGFPDLDDDDRKRLVQEYLDRYSPRVSMQTIVFPGLDELLLRLDDAKCPWGVVTNKPEFLTTPLMAALGLDGRSKATISGDTLEVRKPAPEPLLHACELAGVRPQTSLYIGDALRDIEAGQAAGMTTVAAAYGYITDDDDPGSWGADIVVTNTRELAQIVLKAVNLTV